ncbi:hypothetical protein PXO_05649 [Xanthomonas oryzae pv. oryzae PXO99A]|uniref:Uncharacterized protein n=1 Tax=Xanthomonas oryzae pv. oryzae (strain PXO99A) TaxID=360094 RepID=A0A0K0GLV7_XANOP|nr:hypothetical protein PXO_05649 [Xanthomonas oryzae pv. oryzae PXO99A]
MAALFCSANQPAHMSVAGDLKRGSHMQAQLLKRRCCLPSYGERY